MPQSLHFSALPTLADIRRSEQTRAESISLGLDPGASVFLELRSTEMKNPFKFLKHDIYVSLTVPCLEEASEMGSSYFVHHVDNFACVTNLEDRDIEAGEDAQTRTKLVGALFFYDQLRQHLQEVNFEYVLGPVTMLLKRTRFRVRKPGRVAFTLVF